MLIEICEEKKIRPEVVFRPGEFNEHRHAAERAVVIRYLKTNQVYPKEIRSLCPLSLRQIRKVKVEWYSRCIHQTVMKPKQTRPHQ